MWNNNTENKSFMSIEINLMKNVYDFPNPPSKPLSFLPFHYTEKYSFLFVPHSFYGSKSNNNNWQSVSELKAIKIYR